MQIDEYIARNNITPAMLGVVLGTPHIHQNIGRWRRRMPARVVQRLIELEDTGYWKLPAVRNAEGERVAAIQRLRRELAAEARENLSPAMLREAQKKAMMARKKQ